VQEHRLTLRRTFQAPAASIFQAFLTAEALKEWWAPTGFEVVSAQVDACVGGWYSLELHSQSDAHVVFIRGTFREIIPSSRLVFTHEFEARSTYPPFTAAGLIGLETLVTVELFSRGDVTELVLTQEQIPTSATEDILHEGWRGILEKLAGYVGRVGNDEAPSV